MKKGFAISSMLYAMLILFLVILAAILSVIGSQTLILNKLKKNIFDDLNGSNKIEVYKDKSGASYPNLAGDLIPVYYNDETNTWNKANVYEEWYDYDKKNWANAVLLDNDIIPDISGNGNHGYLQGAIRNDASVTTDGVDDYIYAGLAGHQFEEEFSIVLRTKLLSENENYHHLFSNVQSSGMYLMFQRNKKISFEVYSTTKQGYVAVYSKESYNTNVFYTIVGVFKDNTLHLYINGKEAAEPVEFTGITDIKISTSPFTIGANPPGLSDCNQSNHTCTGIIEPSNIEFTDALIFDRALSENEIKYDYAGKITNLSNTSKMVLRYDLDDEIKPDTPLPEEVIESYFVWIPKYRYKLWDLGNYASITGTAVNNNPNSIGITFNTENTKDINGRECIATNKSGDVGSCNVNEWMTHPAFINFGVDGFWVGKFEISKSSNNIAVKPNSETLISTTLKDYFDYIYSYRRDLDSHMIKNTEWGAVAYLSHSKYGINQNIGINNYRNNGKFMTGCGANSDTAASTTCTPYNTAVGMQASTTGNIYGVYDMSGGTWEFTAAYTANNYSLSGFDANSIKGYDKYFDVYQNNSSTENHTGRILGDATGEIGPFVGKGDSSQGWYADRAVFDTTHWFVRGGYASDTNRAGIFAYSTANGGPTSTIHSSRVILTPK